MKYATFDIEISGEMPNGVWDKVTPLGVSCAALNLDGKTEFFHEPGKITDFRPMLQRLLEVSQTHRIVTWNGAGFDFRCLMVEAPEYAAAWKEICLAHSDLMLQVTWAKGHFLGLDKALRGAGLTEKTHSVTLKSGDVMDKMSGIEAPRLWREGEYDAVLTYLEGDVVTLQELVQWVEKHNKVKWVSAKGFPQECMFDGIKLVDEVLSAQHPPYASWITSPVSVKELAGWAL